LIDSAEPLTEDDMTIGVLSDTHIPDRAGELRPEVLDIFRQAKVKIILHAGDISTPHTLAVLEKIAPVSAVQGNRDIYTLKNLPMTRIIHFHGVELALVHGYASWTHYFVDKWHYLRIGYEFERYGKSLSTMFPSAQIIVFGHTHRPENLWYNKHLFFNPGSASFGFRHGQPPSIGLLHFRVDGGFRGEIIYF
jgi:uncharacterized protein